MLRKLMMLAAMLAIAGLVVVPAVAQVIENELAQEAESGDFEGEIETALSGDNSNQCAPAVQFGNTGNNQNAQALTQYASGGGLGLGGGSITFEPEFENECAQSVEQAAAAG